MPDLTYAYANARIKAMETRLLTPEQYRNLYNVQSIPEMTAMLQETAYRDALVEASKEFQGVELVLEGLQKDWLATVTKLERILPEKAKKAFSVMVGEWEVQDVKTIISKRALEQEISSPELVNATPQSRKLNEKLLAAKTWEDTVKALHGTPYWESVKADEASILKDKDYRALSVALDRAYVLRVMDFSKVAQRKSTRQLLTEKTDLANTVLVLRLKSFASSEQIEKQLVGPASPRVKQLLDAPSLDAAIALLDLPDDVLQAYQKKHTLSTLEMALEKKFVERVLRTFRTSVLSFGVVLGFLYLKSAEVNNLKRLALGKHFGVEEDLKQFLYVLSG
ncbi:V-type ATPase subunit [Candidatus Micrarchaeota archaeon]|nr:V-type ATPase subunit [Candidatus Micrarchaeota archaeon]